MDLTELLGFSVKNGASGVHIAAGLRPLIQIDGEIRPIKIDPLDAGAARDVIHDIMLDHQRTEFEERWETDFAFEILDVARFRVNAFHRSEGRLPRFEQSQPKSNHWRS